MPHRRTVEIEPADRAALEDIRDHHPDPYMRRRARAILLVVDGKSAYWVARHGLDYPMSPDRVYHWLDRHEEEGIAGLRVREGRGRKPAWFPAAPARSV